MPVERTLPASSWAKAWGLSHVRIQPAFLAQLLRGLVYLLRDT